ncbi:hypothetical protein AMATHDRAFT_44554 [Amanita thiersii Skay4041]|uniref:Rho-GAP domain-containing protein n=1 Tax=Amanita thiersii Skay4041 TaxID=703135 RepID=A0A2A9P1W4_9AGAR|nr:hypothetical protein AMATHDRAFT_44554 [Amanita thiersii Skay4041]
MDQSVPSSRPSTSDPPAHSNGPIPLFDSHLRYLNESCISFFQERKRIEETYIDSLLKLHRKAKQVDLALDERGDLSTTRSAWSEVRDNVEREAQARQAFCATLASDVITPLTALKETQERTRKRIKEDLKESTAAYHEYAETILPRLKTRYNKKFAEVEEQKRVAASVPQSPPIPSTSFTTESSQQSLNVSKSSPSMPIRPTVTGPQPLRALDRRPSGSASVGRNRSPSSSTPFSDLAHQGKKQLNQLMGFLDKGGAVKDSLSSVRENQALRTVRAKREADEADKEYRKGVHWLETLRLRKTKLLESGYKSLELFVEDSSVLVKSVLEKYSDNMTATTTTQTQLSSHLRSIVSMISPEKDVAKIMSYIPRSLASAIPEPILYQHGQVGFCNDLIFGFSLLDYATTKGLKDGMIPKIIRICITEIDKRGLECEGIYRVSGRHAVVHAPALQATMFHSQLQHDIEKDEASFEFDQFKDDIYAVASLLKLYLRELPEPVFRFSLHDRIQHSEDIDEHQANNFALLRAKMRRLHPVHQAVLKALIEHLSRVAALNDKNKMDAKNLAIVFGGVIFGEDELPRGADLLSVQTKDSLMEDLINNAQVLFDDNGGHHSPPLPPTPAGELAAQYSYGSKTTKIATVPASLSSLTARPIATNATNATSLPSTQDFMPRLPPRPSNSIHPSSRANPTNSGKGPQASTEDQSASSPTIGGTGGSQETRSQKSSNVYTPRSSLDARHSPSDETHDIP